MFEVLTYLILIVGCLGLVWVFFIARDSLHPLVFLIPAAIYFNVVHPFRLNSDGLLSSIFHANDLIYLQSLNLVCLTSLVIGCIQGSGNTKYTAFALNKRFLPQDDLQKDRLYKSAMILGGIALLMYLFNLHNVGGFVEAYSVPKGGGTAGSGYLRDFVLLAVPATTLFYLAQVGRRWRWHHWLILLVMAAPNLVHGLLSARRGPTFIAIASLLAGWFYSRATRPRIIVVLTGLLLGGLLLLALVTFRGEIYLGSSIFKDEAPGVSQVLSKIEKKQFERLYGNEFVYATLIVNRARIEKDYFWGARWLTILFIRPIPSQIWPHKYEDVGMESLLINAGTVGREAGPILNNPNVGRGTAPGIIADSFVEFSWGAILVLYLVGYIYGNMWRRAVISRGFWIIVYTSLTAYSAYLISQTMGAMLVRLLVTLIPTWVVWKISVRRSLEARKSPVIHRNRIILPKIK